MSGEAQVLLFSGQSSAKLVYSGVVDDNITACYPAPITSNRGLSPTSYKTLPRLPRYRDTKHAIDKQSTWGISLIISVIFAVLCIIPAPLCSIATFILTHEAIKTGKLGRYRKRDIKKNWALCCSMISFIIGALTLASLSTLCGFAVAYW